MLQPKRRDFILKFINDSFPSSAQYAKSRNLNYLPEASKKSKGVLLPGVVIILSAPASTKDSTASAEPRAAWWIGLKAIIFIGVDTVY